MAYQAAIFDLDGTLLNTIEDISVSLNYALVNAGFPTYSVEQVKKFVGSGVNIMIERALKIYQYSHEQFQTIKNNYMEHYKKNQNVKTAPYKGMIEVLKKLKEMQIKVAVLSNKPHLDTFAVIKHYFGEEYFDYILGQRDGVPVKPDPTAVNELIGLLGCAKDKIIFIGDSDVDMQTARNASLDCIGVTWGFRTEEEILQYTPKFIVYNAEEIVENILK